jgi:hypothetical protein
MEPKKIAEYHCDKHVVKQILETGQLLCGASIMSGCEAPYKLSHKNHPCSIWARECEENYVYLCDIGLELCNEYTHRYNKRHATQSVIEWCLMNIPNLRRNFDITTPPMAMPEEYKEENDFVASYRNYYMGAKKSFAKWTKRETPYWFI